MFLSSLLSSKQPMSRNFSESSATCLVAGQPKKEEIHVRGFLLAVLLAAGFSVGMVSVYR